MPVAGLNPRSYSEMSGVTVPIKEANTTTKKERHRYHQVQGDRDPKTTHVIPNTITERTCPIQYSNAKNL
jgi:hypothetical protein